MVDTNNIEDDIIDEADETEDGSFAALFEQSSKQSETLA